MHFQTASFCSILKLFHGNKHAFPELRKEVVSYTRYNMENYFHRIQLLNQG